ncbi:hypothetical protein DV735_g2061, partial [Chaetothyriales sp. CBS 134920]
MANNLDSFAAAAAAAPAPESQFEARRSELLVAISASFETVLQQVNRLNRTLEGIIEIGSEFGSVEALWSQFESDAERQDHHNRTVRLDKARQR